MRAQGSLDALHAAFLARVVAHLLRLPAPAEAQQDEVVLLVGGERHEDGDAAPDSARVRGESHELAHLMRAGQMPAGVLHVLHEALRRQRKAH